LVFFSVNAHQAPNLTNDSERRSFVVIAAFNLHYNAKRYTEYIRGQEMNAEYAFNKQRQLYYVYALMSEEDNKAKDLVWKLRENADFNDAWVFRGRLAENEQVAELIRIDRPEASTSVTASTKSIPATGLNKTSHTSPAASSKGQLVAQNEQVPTPTKVKEPRIKEQYKLYVNTINVKKFKEVRGAIEIRDNQRDKKLKAVNSHQLFGVNDPKNGNHTIKVVSRIFGYRPAERVINLEQPINDSTSMYVETIGDSIIVNFDLERLRKGEIAVMWNVLFFKDAAIMRPESKGELNNLLAMLKENDRLKIKIHGHTNGSSHGKLLHLNLEDKDFFSLSGNHMEDVGSAKKLSEYRGYAIQHYLMEQGIDESRMEITGWGGKKMLYDKHDSRARKNVRVEIEITDI
jgi:outer membrane protein OmpA-like peptidoglycan-associated protein